jgi:hypothetical protein
MLDGLPVEPMSLVLAGPGRIYVLLLFWQRLADACLGCPAGLSRAMSVGTPDERDVGCGPPCRSLLTVRVGRVLRRRFIGLTLFVLESEPSG